MQKKTGGHPWMLAPSILLCLLNSTPSSQQWIIPLKPWGCRSVSWRLPPSTHPREEVRFNWEGASLETTTVIPREGVEGSCSWWKGGRYWIRSSGGEVNQCKSQRAHTTLPFMVWRPWVPGYIHKLWNYHEGQVECARRYGHLLILTPSLKEWWPSIMPTIPFTSCLPRGYKGLHLDSGRSQKCWRNLAGESSSTTQSVQVLRTEGALQL